MKPELKKKAITLRRAGKSYSEILAQIPVAKSTLSLWLREVGLSNPQKQRPSAARKAAALRGAMSRRLRRLVEVQKFADEGILDIGCISQRELWLIGIALYWAEGNKQNVRSPSSRIQFGNSDPRMLNVFLAWLKYMNVQESDIGYELYIHSDRKDEIVDFRKWWAKQLGVSYGDIGKVYLKKGNPKTKRSNTGDLYHGLIRIRVRSSTVLNRRINGWSQAIAAAVGSGVTGNTSAFEAEDSRIVP